MKIVADQDLCIASGQCMLAAPGVFDQDEAGLVEVLADTVDDDVRKAVAVCPSRAIWIDE